MYVVQSVERFFLGIPAVLGIWQPFVWYTHPTRLGDPNPLGIYNISPVEVRRPADIVRRTTEYFPFGGQMIDASVAPFANLDFSFLPNLTKDNVYLPLVLG